MKFNDNKILNWSERVVLPLGGRHHGLSQGVRQNIVAHADLL